MSLTEPRDTRLNLEHRCESLAVTNRTTEHAPRPDGVCVACVASVPALVRCACLGVGCLSASRVCPALSVCSLSCMLGYLPVRCQATQVCSTMFALGYSCCCACGARGVLVCLRMFAQHAARLSRSDILPWATPFWFFLFVLLRFSE